MLESLESKISEKQNPSRRALTFEGKKFIPDVWGSFSSLPVIPCEDRWLDPQAPHEARPLGGPFTPPEKVFGGFWKTMDSSPFLSWVASTPPTDPQSSRSDDGLNFFRILNLHLSH